MFSFSRRAISAPFSTICLCALIACTSGGQAKDGSEAASASPAVSEVSEIQDPAVTVPSALAEFFEENDIVYDAGSAGEGVVMRGPVLEAFKQLDEVRNRLLGYAPGEMTYRYLGSMDVADSVNCEVYSVTSSLTTLVAAILIKEGSVTGGFLMSDDGADSGFRTSTEVAGRGEFIVSTFSLDMVNEDGSPKGGRDCLAVGSDGCVSVSHLN